MSAFRITQLQCDATVGITQCSMTLNVLAPSFPKARTIATEHAPAEKRWQSVTLRTGTIVDFCPEHVDYIAKNQITEVRR